MSDGYSGVQGDLLDVGAPNERAGFRLHRFEVFNWGTFDGKVWSLDLKADSGLLTGDIGSGKSTLVDGLVTLLVPPQKLSYNKAAGAELRERSLRTYVLGQYKSERGDAGGAPRSVLLRDGKTFSILLGHFHNEGYGQDVTLAQVLWMREADSQPARLYLVADSRLSITEHFQRLGADTGGLKKRLKALTPNVYDSFPPYQAAFRRRFGIENEQALDLFLQTVSMKSVGNLTDFVRQHMLQPFAVEPRLAALIAHFDDLNRAHEEVLKAKRQVARLEPLVEDCQRHATLALEVDALRGCREALRPWFAEQKARFIEVRLGTLAEQLERARLEGEQWKESLVRQGLERDRLKQAIQENGGARIEEVKAALAQRGKEREERFQRAERYGDLARQLDLPAATDAETFVSNTRAARGMKEQVESGLTDAQNALTEVGVELRTLKREHEGIAAELESLRRQRSNIPLQVLKVRDRLCAELGLDASALPFAGELLQVREGEGDWQGAIERVLHSFGIALLVSDVHYPRVAQWVERTHLNGRLVYFRVREDGAMRVSALQSRSLVHKLVIKPDSGMRRWLEAELARRFDYACCDTVEEFQSARLALTRAGQQKGANERHEKDDRYRLEDRSRWVLGWTNEQKRMALETKARTLEAHIQDVAVRHQALEAKRAVLQHRGALLSTLAAFDSFPELDWKPVATDIQRLEAQLHELESASNVLRTLERQLKGIERALEQTRSKLEGVKMHQGSLEAQEASARKELAQCHQAQREATDEHRASYAHVERLCGERGGALDADTCDERERQVREALQQDIDSGNKRLARVRDAIIGAMQEYRGAYPLETREVDASLDAAGEYSAMLTALRTDGLPRFEARFKSLLNENTIREVANFQAQLHRERQDIRDRIETINRSLREIPYNPDRYIALELTQSTDPDVRNFQHDLRACTEGALTGWEDEAYSEKKFLEVKCIIERFRGRAGSAEADARWTLRVTDVRNWFSFSASERWSADDREHEHYTDSGGKSGGQKEKLAYTVLAASLAYQFGLQWGETRSRSFRFVVIDEAFGRASDPSTTYGLELFRRLSLQLLIVTPLQKVHIIEPYVASVGYVHNDDGRSSKVLNLTIEEYRARRAARSA